MKTPRYDSDLNLRSACATRACHVPVKGRSYSVPWSRGLRRAIAAFAMLAITSVGFPQFASHVLVSHLDNPRGLAFGADGALYIAEAGHVETPGADTPSITVRGAPLYYGESGAITRWHGGMESQVLGGLPTLYNPVSGEVSGVHGLGFNAAGDLFFSTGLGANPTARTGAELGRLGLLMRLPAGGTAAEVVADVSGYEAANNPAGGPVDSNPFKLTVHAGGVFVADAGANAVLDVGFDGSIDLVGTLAPHPSGAEAVPTSLALSDVGELYVSQLTGFPFPVGGAGVYRVEAGGGLSLVSDGFTNVIDLAYGPDGKLYVLEFAHFGLLSGDPTGGLWRLDPMTGLKELLLTEGLIAPTALAFDDQGRLVVANRGVLPGQGEVLRFTPVPEPAATAAMGAGMLIALVWWRLRRKPAHVETATV